MNDKHCKDVTEDRFNKNDQHYQYDPSTETLPGVESFDYQPLLKQKRLKTLHKNINSET
jgi:hypothetical protein